MLPLRRTRTLNLALVLTAGLLTACTAATPHAEPAATTAPGVRATRLPPGNPATTAAPTATPPAPPPTPRLLVEPDDGYRPVDAFIAGARHSLDMTMYELSDPTAESALTADAARSVDVRVLLDADDGGSRYNAPAFSELAGGGVHVAWSNAGEIFHQKTITVDDATSLIMTGNLVTADEATSHDFAVTDTDAADVGAVVSTFDADFAGGAPGPAPAGSGLLWSPGSQSALVALIESARHTVVTESEEMNAGDIESALEVDARRGVVVDVVMTDSSSWHGAFAALEAAGVHVVVYEGKSPLYIHAKAVLVDGGSADQRAFLGSQNFSIASMEYNRELGVVTGDPTVVDPLATVLARDVAGGTPWT